MLPSLMAFAAGSGPNERDYRLTVRAAPHTTVALHARMPHGWVAAFCTPSVCAPGRVVVLVPVTGTSTVALHIYRVEDSSPRESRVTLQSKPGVSLILPVTF